MPGQQGATGDRGRCIGVGAGRFALFYQQPKHIDQLFRHEEAEAGEKFGKLLLQGNEIYLNVVGIYFAALVSLNSGCSGSSSSLY